ncbi:MAG: hypothetical protein ACTSXA_00715, partial [Candidatus Heimdallarchaeota archaeon]
RNIALGYQAGYNNDTTGNASYGDLNLFLGYRAGYGDAGGNTGYRNIAVGAYSQIANQNGIDNVSLGAYTLYQNVSGNRNFVLGAYAGYDITDGDDNTLIGYQAGCNIGGGDFNLALGGNSLYSLVSASNNAAVGDSALHDCLGGYNVAVGRNSFYYLENGTFNTGVGYGAGQVCDGHGNYNTCIGAYSGKGTLGNKYDYVTYIGHEAGYSVTTADAGIYLGYKAGYHQTNTTGLLIVDSYARADAATEAIESILYGRMFPTVANQTLTINAATTIGNSTTAQSAYVYGPLTTTGTIYTASNIGILTGSPSGLLDIKGGGVGIDLYLGGDTGTTGDRTNENNKSSRLALAHYLNAEQPVGILYAYSTSTANALRFGGGTSSVNAATQVDFYTTSDTITTTGTRRMQIDSGGNTKIGDGGSTNYLNVANDGEINLHGTARVYKKEWMPAGAIRAQGANPASEATNASGFIILEFADSADDYAQADIMVPPDMDYSEDSYICLGWSVPNLSANMTWGYGYLITAEDNNTEAAATTGTQVVTSSGTANGLNVDSIITIAGGTFDSDDVCIHVYFYRDVSADTYGAPVDVHGMAFKYVSNKLGEAL